MSEKECRICLKGDNLMKPCNCRKEFAYVHSKCLKEWLEMTGNQFCDVCGFCYILEKRTKSLRDWFADNNEFFELSVAMIDKAQQALHCILLSLVAKVLLERYFGHNFNHWNGLLYILCWMRGGNMIYILFIFITKLYEQYSDWIKTNFFIQLMPNPNRIAKNK